MTEKSLIKFRFNTEEISLVFAVNNVFMYLLLYSKYEKFWGWHFKLLDFTLIIEHKIRFNLALLGIIKQIDFNGLGINLEDLLKVSFFKLNSWVLFEGNNKTNKVFYNN
jgi:hypothetical protein